MTNVKEAHGMGNTQVGQNLTNEKIRITNLTINVTINGSTGWKFFKKLLKKLNGNKSEINEKINEHLSVFADNNSGNSTKKRLN